MNEHSVLRYTCTVHKLPTLVALLDACQAVDPAVVGLIPRPSLKYSLFAVLLPINFRMGTEQAARPYYVSRYQAWKHASHVTFYGGSCAGFARK